MTALAMVACAVCRHTDKPASADDARICQGCADNHMEPCDSCERPVDTNLYAWKLVHRVGRDLVICRACVERSPEDYGY